MKSSGTPNDTSGLVAGIAAFVTWGIVPIYWKLFGFIPAGEILAHRFVWTCIFMVLLLELAAPLERSDRQSALAPDSALLRGERDRHCDQLVRVYLGGECRTSARDKPRLLHDTTRECAFRRNPFAGTTDPRPARFCSARDQRSSLFDGRFRKIAVGRVNALFLVWALRASAKGLGRSVNSGAFSRNDRDCAARRGVAPAHRWLERATFRQRRPARLAAPGQHWNRHGRAAALVCVRRPTLAPNDTWISAIPRAELYVLFLGFLFSTNHSDARR